MARKLLVKIPEDATREAREVVEALSEHRRYYVLGLPEAFKKKDAASSLYVFHIEDWLSHKPTITRALGQLNFKPSSEDIPYHPFIFLRNEHDHHQLARADIFEMKMLKQKRHAPAFKYVVERLDDFIEHEQLLKLPLDDSDSSAHLPAISGHYR